METYQLDEIYLYKDIEEYASDNIDDITIVEHGNEVIGTFFVVLIDENTDKAVSFVAVSWNKNGFNMKCIYTDYD